MLNHWTNTCKIPIYSYLLFCPIYGSNQTQGVFHMSFDAGFFLPTLQTGLLSHW